MPRTLAPAVVLAAAALTTSAAHAAVVVYQFDGPIITNTMTSGGFVGAPIGAPVTLQITVETSNVPSFTNTGRNHWDNVSGTILGVKAIVNGYTSVIAAPDSAPVYARVCDDASNGGSFIDQFWIEADTSGPAPDFYSGTAILSTIAAAAPVSSSLTGTDFPTDPSELVVSSFANEHYILLKGAGGKFLRADITAASVVPAPGTAMLATVGLGFCARRRR